MRNIPDVRQRVASVPQKSLSASPWWYSKWEKNSVSSGNHQHRLRLSRQCTSEIMFTKQIHHETQLNILQVLNGIKIII